MDISLKGPPDLMDPRTSKDSRINIHSNAPGHALSALMPYQFESDHRDLRTTGNGNGHSSSAFLDDEDWVDPEVVDARDTHDPVRLATWVLVASHLGNGCKGKHSPDCEAATPRWVTTPSANS